MTRSSLTYGAMAGLATVMLAAPARADFDLFAWLKSKPAPAPPLISPLDAKTLGYTVVWTGDLAIPDKVRLEHVARLDDMIVAIDDDHLATAVSVADGGQLWQTSLGMATGQVFAPARWGKKVLVNSETDLLLLAPDTGQIVERQNLDWPVSNSPTLIENIAVFGAINGRLFGHDLRTGYHKWAYNMGSQILARPTLAGNEVFAATTGGFFGLFSSRGEKVWIGRAHDRITTSAVVDRLSVIIPSEDHNLYAIARATGRDQWIYHTTEPLNHPLALIERVVLLPLAKPEVVALDSFSGKELWRIDGKLQVVNGNEGKILVNFFNALMILDAHTGKPLLNVPVQELRTVLPGTDGSLILVSPKGRMAKLNPGA